MLREKAHMVFIFKIISSLTHFHERISLGTQIDQGQYIVFKNRPQSRSIQDGFHPHPPPI